MSGFLRIVVSGNIFDGFEFHGPFDSFDDACNWADGSRDCEWYVTNVKSPVEALTAENGGYYWSNEAKEIVKRMVTDGV